MYLAYKFSLNVSMIVAGLSFGDMRDNCNWMVVTLLITAVYAYHLVCSSALLLSDLGIMHHKTPPIIITSVTMIGLSTFIT